MKTTHRATLALLLLPLLSCAAPVAAGRLLDVPAEGERSQVIVVGGGLAGLSAAYALEKRGLKVHLLEATERLGGKVATADYGDGLTAEFGMQEIWAGSPLLGIARELKLETEEESAFSSVLLDGKITPYTQETDEAYFRSLFSPEDFAAQQRWLKETEALFTALDKEGMTPALARLNNLSFADWLEETQVPARVQQWIRLTLECELAASAEKFSALSGLAELRVFLFGGEKNFHIKGGNSRLVAAMAGAIKGPKTLLARVTRVERHRSPAGAIDATVTYLKNGAVHTLTADRVVLAIPWMLLHTVQLTPPLSPGQWESALTIGRGQYTVVHFLVDREARKLFGAEAPFPILSDGPLGVIYGIDGRAPASSKREIFSLLVYGEPAKVFHMVSHDEKRKELLGALDALWPGFSGHVQETFIYPYHPAAVPFWPAGRSPFDAQAALLFAPNLGLYLAGDYLVSSHSEGAVRAGLRQAEAIAAELGAAK